MAKSKKAPTPATEDPAALRAALEAALDGKAKAEAERAEVEAAAFSADELRVQAEERATELQDAARQDADEIAGLRRLLEERENMPTTRTDTKGVGRVETEDGKIVCLVDNRQPTKLQRSNVNSRGIHEFVEAYTKAPGKGARISGQRRRR